MENYYIDQVEIGILKGKLMDPIRADKPYQTIASEDIGAFAALAFERPKELIGLELEIAGSELTNPEAAQVFSRVLGKPVRFRKLPMPMVRLVLGKEFYQMFRWFNEAGFKADIAGLRRRYPEVHLQNLELARLRLRPTRRVQLSAVSYQRSAASRNRKGSVCQPTSEPRPMLCLYRSCLHKPASASPRESPALMRHNGPRSARYFGLGRALQGNRRPLGPCVAARHWPRGAHTRGVHAKGDVYAISKT